MIKIYTLTLLLFFITFSNFLNAQCNNSFTSETVCTGQPMHFLMQTPVNGDFFTWDFGDGNISFDINPIHSYSAPGNYTVTLSTGSNNGCTSSITNSVTVNDISAGFTACTCLENPVQNTVTSIIPNHSFEQNTGCPDWWIQFNLASGWTNSSNATPDYWNTTCALNPFLLNDPFVAQIPPSPPLPIPDGTGYVGILNGFNSITGQPWLEYIGTCLPQPLLAGTSYTFEFDVAYDPTSFGVPDITWTVFGSGNCGDIPFSGTNCPTLSSPNFTELASQTVTVGTNWQTVTMTFTPTSTINSFLIGPACSSPANNSYFFVDNLVLNTTQAFIPPPLVVTINPTGNPCSNNYLLTSQHTILNSNTQFQWFHNDVPIAGATQSSLNIAGLGLPTTGIYQLIISNDLGQCSSASFDVPNSGGSINTGFNYIPVCINESVLMNNTSTSSNGALTYQWNINGNMISSITNPNFNSSNVPNGSVLELIATDPNGCSESFSQTINYNPLPTASISSSTPITVDPISGDLSTTLCLNDALTLNGSGGTTISWSNGINDGVSFTPALGTQNYVVTVTDANGCSNTESINVTVTAPLTPIIDAISPICEGSDVTLSATPAGGTWSIVTGGGTINGTTYTSPTVSANTTVTVRYTIPGNGACPGNFSDATFIVNDNPAAANNTTSASPICETETLNLTATPAGGSWNIISGGGTISGNNYTSDDISANTNVTISYTVPSIGGCLPSSSDVTFIINPTPDIAVNMTPTTSICEGSDVALSATPAGGTWSIVTGGGTINGTTYTSPTVSANTTVTVRYTIPGNGACPGNFSDATFIVNDNPAAANNTTSASPICETETLNLTATPAGGTWNIISGGGTISGNNYTSDDISTNTNVTISYTTPSVGGCPPSSSNATFIVNYAPDITVNTTPTTSICEGSDVTLSATPAGGTWSIVSGGGIINGTTYTAPTVNANATATVRYTIPANGSCPGNFSDATFTVNDNPDAANNTTSTSPICAGTNVNLTATPLGGSWTILNGGGGTIIGDTYISPTSSQNSTITLRYSIPGNGTCDGSFSDVSFNLYSSPEANFDGINLSGCSPICPSTSSSSTINPGSSIELQSWTYSDGFTETGNSTTYCFSNTSGATQSFDLTLIVISDNGCTDTLTASNYIQVYPQPIAEFNFSPSQPTIINSTVQFDNQSSFADTYQWNIGSLFNSSQFEPTFTFPFEEAVYSIQLIASTINDCHDTIIKQISIDEIVGIYVPNTFTPDGNQANNVFIPVITSGIDPNDFSLMIFNRWGELVFETNDFEVGWDGTYKGLQSQDGTYTWKIRYKYKNIDKYEDLVGHVNLLR